MPKKSYSVKTKFSKKQIHKFLKDENFKHDLHNHENGDIELELEGLPLKDYNKMTKLKNGKPFVVKKGSGFFDSIRRGFQSAGDTLKNTFSSDNAKTAVKVAVPGIVGGVTSFGVGAATTAASDNPLLGAAVGGLAGAAASKGTSMALNKALGDGIKLCGHKRKCKCEQHSGGGLGDMFMTFVADPRVQSALLAAGSYAAKRSIDTIINRVGRAKVDKAKEFLDKSEIPYQDNEYYKKADNLFSKGVKEQQKYKTLSNDYQSGKLQSDAVNKINNVATSKVNSVIPTTTNSSFGYVGSGIRKVKGGAIIVPNKSSSNVINSGVVIKGGSFSGLGNGIGGAIGGSTKKAVDHVEDLPEDKPTTDDHNISLRAYIDDLWKAQQVLVAKAQEHQKEVQAQLDAGRKVSGPLSEYAENSFVLLSYPENQKPIKFHMHWRGPRRVVKQLNGHHLTVQICSPATPKRFTSNGLNPFTTMRTAQTQRLLQQKMINTTL